MGILDILSSAPTKNPYAGTLSDEAWSYYEQMQSRQRTGRMLRTLGNTLSNAAWGRPPTGGGGGGGSQDELVRMMKMNQILEARQDRDAARQRQKTKDTANAAVIAKIRGQGGPVGPETPVRGYAGAAPVTAQALPPKRPLSGLRNDPEFIANLMAGDPKLATGLMFPKTKQPQYYKPQVVREDDKDVLKRYSKSGRYPPLEVKAGPALRPDKDTRTAHQKNIPYLAKVMGISEKEVAGLVTQSKEMSPQQFRQKIVLRYMGGGMNTAEEAAKQADVLMKMFYPGMKPLMAPEPAPAPSSPSLIDQAMSYFKPSASATAPSETRTPLDPQKRGGSLVRGARRPPATLPGVGETVTIDGKSYEVMEPNPDGTVTLMDLATGREYIAR